MTYDFHTTLYDDRRRLMEEGEFVWKKIKPTDYVQLIKEEDRSKPIVWEEESGRYYEINYWPVYNTIKQIDINPNINYRDTFYYSYWWKIKGEEYIETKIRSLKELLNSMKSEGFKRDLGPFGGICIERTGEKMDGSHRCLVAEYLHIPEIEVKEYAFNWRNISWDWLKIKTKAREMGLGPNYYLIDYGDFKNLEQSVSNVYTENAYDRWEVLKDLITGNVLDLGCNDGFMSIHSALSGHKTHGVDYKFVEGAWLNKLIFEKKNEKDLDVDFEVADLNTYKIQGNYDTCLLLNVIYHTKNKKEILTEVKNHCKQVIMQGNLRKLPAHDRYYGITVEDMEQMLTEVGYKTQVIEWRDKPIVIGYETT